MKSFIKKQERGSAGVEFVLAGAFMALLIYASLNFFFLILQATENHLQARNQTFEILEGIQEVGPDGCLLFPQNEADEVTITQTGPARDYYFMGPIVHDQTMPQTVVAWAGHKKSC